MHRGRRSTPWQKLLLLQLGSVPMCLRRRPLSAGSNIGPRPSRSTIGRVSVCRSSAPVRWPTARCSMSRLGGHSFRSCPIMTGKSLMHWLMQRSPNVLQRHNSGRRPGPMANVPFRSMTTGRSSRSVPTELFALFDPLLASTMLASVRCSLPGSPTPGPRPLLPNPLPRSVCPDPV